MTDYSLIVALIKLPGQWVEFSSSEYISTDNKMSNARSPTFKVAGWIKSDLFRIRGDHDYAGDTQENTILNPRTQLHNHNTYNLALSL